MPGDGVDSVYLGDGNDFAFVELADLAIDSVIDGGPGSDWLSFIVNNGADYLNGNPQKSITFNLSTDSAMQKILRISKLPNMMIKLLVIVQTISYVEDLDQIPSMVEKVQIQSMVR